MAAPRALARLFRVLEMEEEQCKLALEFALGELHRLEQALAGSAERERGGRRLVAASAHTGELTDRLAGLEETRSARRQAGMLRSRIEQAAGEVVARREAFRAKRVERRQAETLLRAAEAREATEAGRRSQQALDEWYLSQRQRGEPAASVEPEET